MGPDGSQIEIDAAKRDQLEMLFDEFVEAYLTTEDGRRQIELYERTLEQGRDNHEEIIRAAEGGQDVTEQVLRKLLPYDRTAANREKGAWTPVAPAIQGDLKRWYENNGWTRPDDWPCV